MKRFYFIAAMAIMAAACQKTEIQNEVLTPIGFSTEVGKQTKAIVTPVDNDQQAAHPTNQPFAVYAYGHQDAEVTLVMDNVEVSYQTDTWKATSGSYYWPNDPTTTLNFYAYSPYIQRPATQDVIPTATDDDKNMIVTSLSHTENGGLVFTGYTHSNMYVDFMEATSVIGAKYSSPGGSQNSNSVTSGTVPMTFNHKMTQVLFNVTTDQAYPGIKFTIKSITLNGINNSATYNNGTWSDTDGSTDYSIFPADSDNGAVLVNPDSNSDTVEDEVALVYADDATVVLDGMTTTGVTMIPQTILQGTHKFTIEYKVEGKGVATETVTKTVELYKDGAASNKWVANRKITYKVMIGLNEIKFEPVVANWESEVGSEYTFQQ